MSNPLDPNLALNTLELAFVVYASEEFPEPPDFPPLDKDTTGLVVLQHDDTVACAKCARPVYLSNAYIDPFVASGRNMWVHYECLSSFQRRYVDSKWKDVDPIAVV